MLLLFGTTPGDYIYQCSMWPVVRVSVCTARQASWPTQVTCCQLSDSLLTTCIAGHAAGHTMLVVKENAAQLAAHASVRGVQSQCLLERRSKQSLQVPLSCALSFLNLQ